VGDRSKIQPKPSTQANVAQRPVRNIREAADRASLDTGAVAPAKQGVSLLDKPPLHFAAVRRPTLFKPSPRKISQTSSNKRRVQRRSKRSQKQVVQKHAQLKKERVTKPVALKLHKQELKDTKVNTQPSIRFTALKKFIVKLSSFVSTKIGFNPLSKQTVASQPAVRTDAAIAADTQAISIAGTATSALVKRHHPQTVKVAKRMRLRAVARIVDAHIVRPMIWSGMRAARIGKQPTNQSTRRSHIVSTKQAAQIAIAMPAIVAQSNRTTSGHEVFIQRGNGLRTQASNASAAVAISGQQQAGKQSKATVMGAASQWNPAMAMRGSGRANPMLSYPAPVIMQQIDSIDRPEIQINDRLYSVIDQIEPEIGEELLACIMEQLGQGPKSLTDDEIRIQANSLLPSDIEEIDADTWKALLQETLVIVFQNVLPFDGHGMKKREAIYADAALVLDIDDELFIKWEACFNIDCLMENLVVETDSSTRFVQDEYESVVRAISEQVAMRANAALTPSHYQGAVIHSFETEAQWTAARFCAITHSRNKVATTTAHLAKTVKKDKNTAARIMALIASYSGISRRPATRAPVPRWSKEELQSLIEGLSKHAPSLLTNAQFRSQLTTWENKAFNQLVHRVNHENSMDQLRKLSPKEPFEAFFDLLEKSGQEDEVLHDIWQDMARNLSKLN